MTRDRILVYAVAISVAVHLGAAVVIGRTSAARLSAAPPPLAPRYINVDLIDLPAKQAPKPSEAPTVSLPKPAPPVPARGAAPPGHSEFAARPAPAAASPNRAAPTKAAAPSHLPAGDPGGKLNVGSTSAAGDLPGNWTGGKTPVGWVPDPHDGPGKGSGSSPGTGNPEPPKQADPGPGTRPAPAQPTPPPPPPPPAKVNVRVCSNSGLLPGPNCTQTTVESFTEGSQPTKVCDKCQPPHKSRLADRAEPQLIGDSRLTVPASVPEGLSLRVEVQYTVTADGDVTDVVITKSSGYKALDRAVVSAASRMKYKPAVQDGVPRSVKRTRTYTINT